jgi:heat shock protein 1/8
MSSETSTTIIGLDFGSHTTSIAIWAEEQNTVDCIADDLGSRTIPCAVAYRAMGSGNDIEILTGQSAIAQQHKNPKNTFDDVRSLLLNTDKKTVTVPVLDKEVTIEELASHYFRNIHNQIKQQIGKACRDCIVSLPVLTGDIEAIKKRITESAQAGGIRIKSFIIDSTASLLACNLDDVSAGTASAGLTLHLDVGWSACQVTLCNVSGGLFIPLGTDSSADVSGSNFVKLLVEHCAKDFTRKTKCPFPEYSSNNKSVIRLKRECENAMKSLSTGAEATIDIDSLYEGMDYSSKISRARYEDLLTIPIIKMKKMMSELVQKHLPTAESTIATVVSNVCISGGPTSMPKLMNTMQAMFPSAKLLRGKFEVFETVCIGAALHGKYLFEDGLLDKAPLDTHTAVTNTLSNSIWLSASTTGANASVILPLSQVLPALVIIPATLPESSSKGYMKVLAASKDNKMTAIGEIVFEGDAAAGKEFTINLAVSAEKEITIEITQTATKLIVSTLTIPYNL